MSNVEKILRATAEGKELVEFFEETARKKGMDVTREGEAPAGYWYTSQETNTAFYWFISGTTYK